MRATLVTLCAVAALAAGCSKKPADAAGKGAAAAVDTPITLAQLPAPKAGMWKGQSSQDGGPPEPASRCMDGKPIDPMGGGTGRCAKLDLKKTAAGGYVIEGDCGANGVSAKMRLAVEGDYVTTFTTDAQMTMGGAGETPVSMRNRTVWTYAGESCEG
jgi:hypothetical protein